jgi:hypothetical protein
MEIHSAVLELFHMYRQMRDGGNLVGPPRGTKKVRNCIAYLLPVGIM